MAQAALQPQSKHERGQMAAGRGRGGRDAARRAMLLAVLPLAGCDGVQSALDPGGFEAAAVARLFWVMLGGAVAIWLGVMALALFAQRRRGEPWPERRAGRLVLWGGAVVPTLILAALLAYGLVLMPALREPGGPLRIAVEGEQFWWRVRYQAPGQAPVEAANEIRLPRGQRVELSLSARDVIHSFWIPALAGKMDMIPGRATRLVLEPTELGRFRGACAEFCGASHALMAFTVEVMEPEAFAAWLRAQAAPAPAPAEPPLAEGQRLFLAEGCGACHAVRGTAARGQLGPDLTHLGSRPSLGAGLLDNTREHRMRFIRETDRLKPAARMPAYAGLAEPELAAIADWLGSLR
ncbi:cytochrome c oxidase subunit II [Pseudoroseomonas cervicalis]|uniref:cytochrome c oxidase subunit II n=1 Tax=Teichococcus cervicalis TaxID=204525 RepID=UPI0027898ED3|nr:cytochrome c oxidase subunit II [Pseudoroseomonas cervicalis]MDQ1081885.1 cytochrome c oxidase subunit 2 [Pseudoroseomonas cervicalis]